MISASPRAFVHSSPQTGVSLAPRRCRANGGFDLPSPARHAVGSDRYLRTAVVRGVAYARSRSPVVVMRRGAPSVRFSPRTAFHCHRAYHRPHPHAHCAKGKGLRWIVLRADRGLLTCSTAVFATLRRASGRSPAFGVPVTAYSIPDPAPTALVVRPVVGIIRSFAYRIGDFNRPAGPCEEPFRTSGAAIPYSRRKPPCSRTKPPCSRAKAPCSKKPNPLFSGSGRRSATALGRCLLRAGARAAPGRRRVCYARSRL